MKLKAAPTALTPPEPAHTHTSQDLVEKEDITDACLSPVWIQDLVTELEATVD